MDEIGAGKKIDVPVSLRAPSCNATREPGPLAQLRQRIPD